VSVLLIAVPAALLLVAGFAWAFVRSARAGAFDDLETPALRILADDEPRPPPSPSAGNPEAPPPSSRSCRRGAHAAPSTGPPPKR